MNQPISIYPSSTRKPTQGIVDGSIYPSSRAPVVDKPYAGASLEVTATVDSVRMFGADWGLAMTTTSAGKEFKITGRVGDLKEGCEYSLVTLTKIHPKYESYELLAAKPYVQPNAPAIVKFIRGNFSGITQLAAVKFVLEIEIAGGNDAVLALRDQLINEPWAVDFSSITRAGHIVGEDRDKTVHDFMQRSFATRVVGINAKVLSSLADYAVMKLKAQEKVTGAIELDPVGAGWTILSSNPYGAIESVDGFGFRAADNIGRTAKVARDFPSRLAALAEYAIEAACNMHGHVFLTHAQAKLAIERIDSQVNPDAVLTQGAAYGVIVLDDDHDVARVYTSDLFESEQGFAKSLSDFCADAKPLIAQYAGLETTVQDAAKGLGGAFKNGLDPSQLKALTGILTSNSRVHTITAEPGAGKTAVMEVLLQILKAKKIKFCAPTGKGAKVLGNRIKSSGFTANTIHSLLQGGKDGLFKFNATEKLDADILVIDEASMPGLVLAKALLDAVPDDAHVIFLGDVDQLPSIAPGCVLADLLSIAEIDHHRLTTVHRNSGAILDVIREVKIGKLETVTRIGVKFSGSLPDAQYGFEAVVDEYLDAVRRSGYEGTALLMSRKKGELGEAGWNTTYANSVLREICNPNATKLPGSTLHQGDRIMITANMTIGSEDEDEANQERVVNGDTGSIHSFRVKSGDKRDSGVDYAVLRLDDGRTINFPGTALQSLQLAYAMTVHASQGSEYKEVITVITPGSPTFINRNMLYTSLSRTRANLSIHGNDSDLRRVAATPMPARNSGLAARVEAFIGEVGGEVERAEKPCAPTY